LRDENVRESGCVPLNLPRAQHPSAGSHPLKGHPCSALRRRIGAEIASKAAPDGYTLMIATSQAVIVSVMYKKLPYQLLKDFSPISMVATTPFILVVHPSVPAASIKELVAYATSKPQPADSQRASPNWSQIVTGSPTVAI